MASTKVLLVEGPDDKHFCHHFTLQLGVRADNIKIKDKGGIERLLNTLQEELDDSEVRQLGIVVDANGDQHARWQAIRDRLQNLGYAKPLQNISEEGAFINATPVHPAIGIWIMPDNLSPGSIEDFVTQLIPSDETWVLAQRVVDEIPVEQRKFPASRKVKAQVHTWLAWQEEPGKPMGQAVSKGYFDLSRIDIIRFTQWLKRLFVLV